MLRQRHLAATPPVPGAPKDSPSCWHTQRRGRLQRTQAPFPQLLAELLEMRCDRECHSQSDSPVRCRRCRCLAPSLGSWEPSAALCPAAAPSVRGPSLSWRQRGGERPSFIPLMSQDGISSMAKEIKCLIEPLFQCFPKGRCSPGCTEQG